MKIITKPKRVMSTRYAIPIKGKYILDIMNKDGINEHGLWAFIDKIDGVENTDYDGHFGSFIYVTLKTESDTEAVWESIYNLINNYVE